MWSRSLADPAATAAIQSRTRYTLAICAVVALMAALIYGSALLWPAGIGDRSAFTIFLGCGALAIYVNARLLRRWLARMQMPKALLLAPVFHFVFVVIATAPFWPVGSMTFDWFPEWGDHPNLPSMIPRILLGILRESVTSWAGLGFFAFSVAATAILWFGARSREPAAPPGSGPAGVAPSAPQSQS